VTDPEIAAAAAALKRAEKSMETRRVALLKAIGEGVTGGRVRQTDAAKQLDVTREHIRRICYSYMEWREGRNPDFKILRDGKAPESEAHDSPSGA
jgi:hypothetical protein